MLKGKALLRTIRMREEEFEEARKSSLATSSMEMLRLTSHWQGTRGG